MGHSSFGPMWPQSNSNIITLVRSDGLRLPIHRDLALLIRMLMDHTEAMGYDIRPGETWGYAHRPISGTNTPSNHSQGTALDINAPANPYASAEWHRANARGTKPFGLMIVCDIPESVVELWMQFGFGWGGLYSSKPDPMHFEFEGTVNDVWGYTKRLREQGIDQGVWTMGAEEKLDTLIDAQRSTTKAIRAQSKTIRKQHQFDRKADLQRELREAQRDNKNTKDILAALHVLDDEIAHDEEEDSDVFNR